MAVFLKDFSTIKRELQEDVRTILPQASQARNSAIFDIFVNPNSTQFSFLYRTLQRILNSTELNTVTGQDLDRYAENFGLNRKSGTTATGSVFFVLDNSFDQGKDIEIPSGTVVTAQAGNGTTSFRTTSTQTLRREDRDIYSAVAEVNRDRFAQAGILDVTYAVEVPITATVTGNRGLVGTYAITGGTVRNVTQIINLSPTTGGFNSESDQALRQRIALVIAGNSVGTVAGVKSAALSVTGVASAFVVTPGNPLMIRDGTVYDEDGNLLQEGRGNAIDVYIFGQRLTDATETYTFIENTDSQSNISLQETIILGTQRSNTIRLQPVVEVGSIIGSESGNNFSLAVESEDEDGNIVLDGQVAFIRDFDAENYSLVRNVTTNELAIARYLDPNSSKYVEIEPLVTSPYANSVRGEDRLIFLKKYSRVSREIIARGTELNGSDSLANSDVIRLAQITEEVKVDRELVKVESDGAFTIYTRHTPVLSVNSVKHVRLGTNFNARVTDSNSGRLDLIGRFAPQSGDYLEVSYVWQKQYLSSFEYYLIEDSVGWIQPDFVIENDSLTIYNGVLSGSMQPEFQPLTPTYLSVNLSNAVKRAVYNLTFTGDISDVYTNFETQYQRGGGASVNDYDAMLFNNLVFAHTDALDSHIGRITKVRNQTRGFDYNLIGYKLESNRFAIDASVNSDLSATQFTLSQQTNLTTVEIGDFLRFNAPLSNASWNSTEELSNNIRGNIKPIYDETKVVIDEELGEVQLVQPEENPNLAETVAEANILVDTTWSGKVRLDSDVTINQGVTLTIEPGTVVQVVSSSNLPSVQEIIQNVKLIRTFEPTKNPSLPSSYNALYYIFFANIVPFFVILSDDGLSDYAINYNTDVISKEKRGDNTFEYKINGFVLDSKYWTSLEAAIVKNGKLIGFSADRVGNSGIEVFYTAYDVIRYETEVFIVPLENSPRKLNTVVYDILLRSETDRNVTQTVQYEPTLGKYAVISTDTATNVDWNLEYGIEIVTRAAINCYGTLIADAPIEGEPIIFTSFATEKKAGDWDGIIFNQASSSYETGVQSVLRNCIIKYANIAIQALNSDPKVDRCIIKNYLSAGGISRNEPRTIEKFTTETYVFTQDMFSANVPQRIRKLGTENIPSTFASVSTLTPSGYGPCGYGYDGYGYDGYGGECGYGYNGCSGTPQEPNAIISGAYTGFTLPIRPQTSTVGGQEIPVIIAVEGNRAIVDLNYGVDYTIFLGNEDITSKAIETFQNCSEVFLVAGIDFNIELDTLTLRPEIVFYNTRNMLAFLYQYAKTPRQFSITFAGVTPNGDVTDSLFHKALAPAWVCYSGSDIRFINNTFYQGGIVPLQISNSYVLLRNNIIAEYTSAPITKDPISIVFADHNNMYSLSILANEPHLPVDTDSLSDQMEIDDVVLPVFSPSKYKTGIILKIDDEFMTVDQVGLEVRVGRGALESTPARHDFGARIILLRRKVFFTITGLPAENAQLIFTDSKGNELSTNPPVYMLSVESGTFRVAIPVDRTNTVFYRYRYWNDDISSAIYTEVRKLPVEQFGDAVNDIYSVAVNESISVYNNYSDDPKFENEEAENYSLLETSPSSLNNPLYSTPWDPSITVNRYIGIVPHEEENFLVEGVRTFTLQNTPLIVGSLIESIVIKSVTTERRIIPASFNPETNQVTLVSPISLRQVGNYIVEYNSPISLGSSLTGYPILGTIQYQYNTRRNVQFTRFKVNLDGVGGLVRFSYRTSTRKDTIENFNFSNFIELDENNELDLLTNQDPENPAVGSIIEFILEIQGNDGSWSNIGNYLYPKVRDFTLSYAPEIDEQVYEVASVQYLPKAERTRVTLDPPGQPGVGILSSTAANLSGIEEIAVNISKEGVDSYFQLAKVRSLNTGDKYVDLIGDFTIARTQPSIGEIVTVDFSYVSRGSSEVVPFVNSSTQLTTNRFVGLQLITSDIVLDRVSQTPGNERLKVGITNQPTPGTGYNVTYDFEAPKNGEVLTVSFTYNSLLANVQAALDSKKDALADVLGREMFGIPISISANVVIMSGFNVNEVIASVTRAISQQFTTFISENPLGGGRIDATDTLGIIKNVNGVDDLVLTSHHREGFVGMTNIVLNTREFPVLDNTSPEIIPVAASDPNTVLTVES